MVVAAVFHSDDCSLMFAVLYLCSEKFTELTTYAFKFQQRGLKCVIADIQISSVSVVIDRCRFTQ